MSEFKLLIVEDNEAELELYRNTLKRYQKEKNIIIHISEANNKDTAISLLDNRFDGAIVDLKLAGDGDEGNKVIDQILGQYRIPVAIMTGTPDSSRVNCQIVTTYTKGKDQFDKVLDDLICVYNTGLTKIMGGRGIIENQMDKIFWQNILPNFGPWKRYVSSGANTEKALLRYIISHLQEILDDDSEHYYIDEMFISPPIHSATKTGSIVTDKNNDNKYIILSPACDLVVRTNGEYKTDKLLICQIEDFSSVKNSALGDITKASKRKNKLEDVLKNNHTNYHHWLPSTTGFSGGFINFRWTLTLTKGEFDEKFNPPLHQVSSVFIKDIISRFASYYARQGQPDFDFSGLADNLL